MTSKSLSRIIILGFLVVWSFRSWGFTVFIDPGHGGIDSGAVNGPIKESMVVLQIGKELSNILNTTPDYKGVLSRDEDISMKLQDRIEKANSAKSDLFISLHLNSSLDPRSYGMEFYFENHLPPDEETLYLAALENGNFLSLKESSELDFVAAGKKTDLSGILQDLNRHYRMRESFRLNQELFHVFAQDYKVLKIKQAPFRVITKVNKPAVLVELGYISHPHEVARLNNPKFQKEMARKIFLGIKNYKEVIDKTPKTILN